MKLQALEMKQSIVRWSEMDKRYKDSLNALMLSKQEQLLLELWKTGQKRVFLLNLKKKYAGILHKHYLTNLFSYIIQMGRRLQRNFVCR